MIRLKEYCFENVIDICEATLSTKDFTKHNYRYVKNIVSMLLDNKPVRLGSDGKLGICDINQFNKTKLEDFYQMLNDDPSQLTIDSFNSCVNPNNNKTIVWTKICKFDARGVEPGQGNKGEEFEKEFINDLLSDNSKYKENLLNVIYKDSKFNNIQIAINETTIFHEGGKNSKRPLIIYKDQLVASNKHNNTNDIGESVTDVTIKPIAGNDSYNIYLSLKEGSQVTFCNCGTNNNDFFAHKMFTDNKPFGDCGKELLKMFAIDEETFRNIFINYNKTGKGLKNIENVSDTVNKTKIINFCKSVIGYGYILCHLQNGKLHIADLRSSAALDNLLKHDLFDLKIYYPSDGNAKRIDMRLKLDNIEIQFNIRSKDGGIFPTHIMSDYKITNYNI